MFSKRVSELHALSVSEDCLRWKAENAGVYLWPNPSFLPKVLRPGMINQVIELDAFLPDLSCSGTGWESSSLCPVRALHTYIKHTRPLRQSHKQLFVCFDKKCAGKPVSKQRLSHWIVDTISQAYSSQNLPVPGDLVAHSTRSMATSWAALKGVALSDICAAASWSTPCTFTRFYRIKCYKSEFFGVCCFICC